MLYSTSESYMKYTTIFFLTSNIHYSCLEPPCELLHSYTLILVFHSFYIENTVQYILWPYSMHLTDTFSSLLPALTASPERRRWFTSRTLSGITQPRTNMTGQWSSVVHYSTITKGCCHEIILNKHGPSCGLRVSYTVFSYLCPSHIMHLNRIR